MDPSLAHLQENPEAGEDVQVVDFDTLAIIDAVISNVNEWGCKVTSEHVEELYKNIGIRFSGARKLSKAQVTSVKGNDAAVVFVDSESKVCDKRREKRNDVKIPVKIADLEGITEIEATIVDAAKNGCKVKAIGLTALPEEVLLTMQKFNKPVVAAVNGICCGGGLELALSADIILAAAHAEFALPEIRSGTVADAASIKLPKRIPYHIAMEMLLPGRWIEAQEAARWGLINHVYPADQLMQEAWTLA